MNASSHDRVEKDQTIVPSVQKALQILNFVAARRDAIGASDIGRQLGLPKSTVHGLCSTLAQMGLLTKDADSRYQIGPQTLVLAEGYMRTVDPLRNFVAEAAKVPALDNETLVLAVLSGTDAIYVATRRGRQNVAISYDVGLRLPANCTSSGKALLSMLPLGQIEELFGRQPFRVMTPNSVHNLDALRTELEAAREVGYATDDEETAVGMYCIAAPITDLQRHPLAAVSVITVKAALSDDKLATYREAIKALAANLSASAPDVVGVSTRPTGRHE
jgi:IclR family transcriptional regulator, blcABC operon repressor